MILVRSDHGALGLPDSPFYDVVSQHVADLLIEQQRDIQLEAALEIYELLNPHPKASAFAGWVWEAIVHQIIPKTHSSLLALKLRDPVLYFCSGPQNTVIDKSNEVLPRTEVDPRHLSFDNQTDIEEALSSLFSPFTPSSSSTSPPDASVRAEYLIPLAQNNPLFDSVLVEASGVIWIIQISISERHGGSSAGIPLLENLRHVVAKQCRKGSPRFRYLYVAPTDRISPKSLWTLHAELPNALQGQTHYLPLCWISVIVHDSLFGTRWLTSTAEARAVQLGRILDVCGRWSRHRYGCGDGVDVFLPVCDERTQVLAHQIHVL